MLPNDEFEWTESRRICEKHWPPGYPTVVINRNGAVRPDIPPSIFPGVPPSCVPTQPPKKRKTLSSSRCNRLEFESASTSSVNTLSEECQPIDDASRYEILFYDHLYAMLT